MEPTPTLKSIPRPHWGYQTSLFQWHQPAFWLFARVLRVRTWPAAAAAPVLVHR